jgi:hypothetical protein
MPAETEGLLFIIKYSTMKIVFFATLIFLTTFNCIAQTPHLPANPPNPNQHDIPKLHVLTPADLQVTTVSVVSFVHNADSKSYVFKLSISTKNFGETRTAPVKLKVWVKPASGGEWKSFGGLVSLPAMGSGQTVSGEYVFKDLEKIVGASLFDVKVQADHGNATPESNESNNYSAAVRINVSSY